MAWQIYHKIKTALQMSSIEWWLLVEAIYTSAYVRFTLSFLPFKKVMHWLGQAQIKADVDLSNPLILLQVHYALKKCSRYTPWKTECYTQALTAKIMLRRRSIPATLYIGFLKDSQVLYKGHAWLKVQEQMVIGYLPNLQEYQVHSFFS